MGPTRSSSSSSKGARVAILLDTNALLALLDIAGRLGPESRRVLEADGTVLASRASLLEVAIKHRAGKLAIAPEQIGELIDSSGLLELGIERRHLAAMKSVELPHRDPFDALLVAQAQSESLWLLTTDQVLLHSVERSLDATA